MSASEMLSEDGATGTQESHPSMSPAVTVGEGTVIWDPESKTYVHVTQDPDVKPDRWQVPGTPPISEDYSMKTKNPEMSGVFAAAEDPSLTAQKWRDAADSFYDMAAQAPSASMRSHYQQKAEYYTSLADEYEGRPRANDPAQQQAVHSPPDAGSLGDVYQDAAPKRNPGMTDDSFPGMISRHTNGVTSTMLNKNSWNPSDRRYVLGDAPTLANCPNGECGGMMTDHDGESVCHDCGHKEKIHYANSAAALEGGNGVALLSVLDDIPALLLRRKQHGVDGENYHGEGTGSPVAEDDFERADHHVGGFLAPLIAPAAEAIGGAVEGAGLANTLRAGSLMARVMGTGDNAGAAAGASDVTVPGSAVADDNMQQTASSISEDDESGYGTENSGKDSEPDSGNKGSEGQDTAADELRGDTDGAGGSQGLHGLEMFEAFEPYLESIADLDDSHEDPIAIAIHEALLKDDPDYLKKAARMEISKIAGGSCPTCQIDLSTAQQCGGPANITCPVGLPHPNASVGMGMNTAPLGQPGINQTGKTADIFNDQLGQWNQMARSVDPSAIDDMRDWLIEYDAANPDNKWAGTRWNTASMSPDGVVLMAMDDFFPGGYQEFADGHNERRMEQEPGSYDEQEREADMGFGAGSMPEGNIEHWAKIKKEAARRPKMCPVHDQLVNYALTLQDPSAALAAFSGSLFGEHSCQGGYEMINKSGNPTKCRYKPEMITQAYWDEKDAKAEERKLQREQQQALQPDVPVVDNFVDPDFVEVEEQPALVDPNLVVPQEGRLVGGPAFEQQQAEEGRGPVVQDIPATDPLASEQDYIPAEQTAEVIQFPQRQMMEPAEMQMAARYKWSGPGALVETPPAEGPEQMFADNPPEELPTSADEGVSTDTPTDSLGNPIKVGQRYEVRSSVSDDVVPDIYKITGVDPNFIQFEVEAGPGKPFAFTSTLSTQQIAADGLHFAPASDNPNAMGDVEPGSDDNTGESDNPTGVTDLDTGGNSHASAVTFVDALEKMGGFWDDDPRRHAPAVPDPYEAPTRTLSDDGVWNEDEGDPDYGLDDIPGSDAGDLLAENQRLRALLESMGANPGDFADEIMARDPGEMDPDQDEDFGDYAGDGGDGHYAGARMAGKPHLDWLNGGGPGADDDDSWIPPSAKTAGKDFSLGEQRRFVHEEGSARNLDKLELSGTHYPVNGESDEHSDFLWG